MGSARACGRERKAERQSTCLAIAMSGRRTASVSRIARAVLRGKRRPAAARRGGAGRRAGALPLAESGRRLGSAGSARLARLARLGTALRDWLGSAGSARLGWGGLGRAGLGSAASPPAAARRRLGREHHPAARGGTAPAAARCPRCRLAPAQGPARTRAAAGRSPPWGPRGSTRAHRAGEGSAGKERPEPCAAAARVRAHGQRRQLPRVFPRSPLPRARGQACAPGSREAEPRPSSNTAARRARGVSHGTPSPAAETGREPPPGQPAGRGTARHYIYSGTSG